MPRTTLEQHVAEICRRADSPSAAAREVDRRFGESLKMMVRRVLWRGRAASPLDQTILQMARRSDARNDFDDDETTVARIAIRLCRQLVARCHKLPTTAPAVETRFVRLYETELVSC